jgi:hypothetical protein
MAACSDADVRRALGSVAVRCADGALLSRLAQAGQQHGLSAKALATRYSAFTINRRAASLAQEGGGAKKGGGTAALPTQRAEGEPLARPRPPLPHPLAGCAPPPRRSDDESKANKVTPALVDAFVAQLARDIGAGGGGGGAARGGGGAAGRGAGSPWGARSWDE